jgi:hypothetical protein
MPLPGVHRLPAAEERPPIICPEAIPPERPLPPLPPPDIIAWPGHAPTRPAQISAVALAAIIRERDILDSFLALPRSTRVALRPNRCAGRRAPRKAAGAGARVRSATRDKKLVRWI